MDDTGMPYWAGMAAPNPHELDSLHDALIVLRLAAYAADAMRVLQALADRADSDPALESSIRAACPDWRNPGCLNEPAGLLSEALACASATMSRVLRDSG